MADCNKWILREGRSLSQGEPASKGYRCLRVWKAGSDSYPASDARGVQLQAKGWGEAQRGEEGWREEVGDTQKRK